MGPPMGHMGAPMMPPMGAWMPMGPMGAMVPMGPMGMGMGPVDGQIFYGPIARYDPAKGFGFIACEPLHEDIFFLRSELPPELKEEGKDKIVNVQVEFEICHSDKGDGKLRARRLRIVPPQHSGHGGHPGRSVGRIAKYG